MTWKRPFISNKEVFKAVMFAEKMLEKGDKTRAKAAEVAANYYKVLPALVLEYMNPELPELQATVDEPKGVAYEKQPSPSAQVNLEKIQEIFEGDFEESSEGTVFEF